MRSMKNLPSVMAVMLAAAASHAADSQSQAAGQAVNVGLQFYGNAGASSWTMRMRIAFLFPTGVAKK